MTQLSEISDAEQKEFETSTAGVSPIADVEAGSAAAIPTDPEESKFGFLGKGIGLVLKTPFEIAAAKTKDPEWKLTPEQLEGLTELASPVITKWIEILTKKAEMSDSPEAALALGLVGMVTIKFLQTRKNPLAMKPGLSTANGKTAGSAAAFSSSENRGAERVSSSLVPRPDYSDLESLTP